jgi:hypothetical protein
METQDASHETMETVALHENLLDGGSMNVGLPSDSDLSESSKISAAWVGENGQINSATSLPRTNLADGDRDIDANLMSQAREQKPLRRAGGFANPIPTIPRYKQDEGEQDGCSEGDASPLEDDVDPPNSYHRDMEIEAARLLQRNKRVLISRLSETSPRGKLSLVRRRERCMNAESCAVLCFVLNRLECLSI